LKMAGIPKRDERGRTLDVHALRTTFGTLLSKGGVAPRTAQAAMRHSDIKLTMGVYTDPKLLDVRGALDVLPQLPLGDTPAAKERATGTAEPSPGPGPRKFAPKFAGNRCKLAQTETTAVNPGVGGSQTGGIGLADVTSTPDKARGPLTSPVGGPRQS